MERRILKDFQIGFVEGIANEVNQQGVKDVFGSIAKAVNIKKGASKGYFNNNKFNLFLI